MNDLGISVMTVTGGRSVCSSGPPEDPENLSVVQLGIIRVGNSAAPQTQEADTPGLNPSSLAQQDL